MFPELETSLLRVAMLFIIGLLIEILFKISKALTPDILIKAIKQGYLFAEVPYRLGLRASGKSKAMSFPSLLQVMKGYLSLIKNQYGFSGKNQLKPVLEETSTAQRHSYENEKYKI